MKKNSRKKLKLTRETIREVTPDELRQVGGGAPTAQTENCTQSCSVCPTRQHNQALTKLE